MPEPQELAPAKISDLTLADERWRACEYVELVVRSRRGLERTERALKGLNGPWKTEPVTRDDVLLLEENVGGAA